MIADLQRTNHFAKQKQLHNPMLEHHTHPGFSEMFKLLMLNKKKRTEAFEFLALVDLSQRVHPKPNSSLRFWFMIKNTFRVFISGSENNYSMGIKGDGC